jgi:hypothetical protein
MMSLDYTVDRMQVIAVRATPPNAPAGTTRTLESLVVDPSGTLEDAAIAYSACGLSETLAVGITDLRCFENPDLVADCGEGDPGTWDVPSIEFRGCIPFDEVTEGGFDMPGTNCASVVPLLATATRDDGEVALGANHVAIAVSEVPEFVRIGIEYGGETEYEEIPTEQIAPVGSRANPLLPVTLTADGTGPEVELEVTLEDPHYNRVAWWVTGGTLDQSGRTLISRDEDGIGHAWNRWILPDEHDGPLKVWVVLTEWYEPYGEIPNPVSIPISQPAWAELTLETP